MRHYFEAFIDDLRSTHGSNLAAVILYGSAAAGDFVPNRSDYNILVALEKIGPEDLRKSHACVREWARLGNPVPVYFTVSELQNAADVFPIEFHQMTVARKVLFGKDVLAGLEISDKFLRHQAEFELRSKLLQLRRQYIPASASVDGLKALMAESLASFAVLFGAMLILRGIEPPATKHEIVALTAEHLGIDGRPFEKIFNIRENNFTGKLDDVTANQLFGEYMEQIERVIDAADMAGK
ncbi:MAG: nucleotidyltransferase domain-containing protein [Pyrinomonadaceae bacterium]|nr:nucleotidyltransferase domain-containing protein [Pyrinomonadaceae bacterium]